MREERYDLIVVGLGLAGCQAALRATGLGLRTLGLDASLDRTGLVPHTPALYIERWAGPLLEGLEFSAALERSLMERRVLDGAWAGGDGIERWGLDRMGLHLQASRLLQNTEGLHLAQAGITEILTGEGRVRGVGSRTGSRYLSDRVLLAAGELEGGLLTRLSGAGVRHVKITAVLPPLIHLSPSELERLQETASLPGLPSTPERPPGIPRATGLTGAQRYPLFLADRRGAGEGEPANLVLEPEGGGSAGRLFSLTGFDHRGVAGDQETTLRSLLGCEGLTLVRPGRRVGYRVISPRSLTGEFGVEGSEGLEGLYATGRMAGFLGYGSCLLLGAEVADCAAEGAAHAGLTGGEAEPAPGPAASFRERLRDAWDTLDTDEPGLPLSLIDRGPSLE